MGNTEPGKEDAQTDCRRKEGTAVMSNQLTRRGLLKCLTGAAAAAMFRLPMQALPLPQADTTTGMERGEIGRLAAAFKRSFSVPALSVAISQSDQFVFDQGFGFNQGFR